MPACQKVETGLSAPSGTVVRLYQAVAEDITAMIKSGEFGKGARLPAERELAVRLSVSRSSVREAIIALEVAGIVETRVGSGTYVLQDGYSSSAMLSRFLATDPGPGPFEINEVRRLIESETAFRAASLATDAQLQGIAAAVQMMRDDINDPSERSEIGDRSFHILIAEASGNSVLALVLRDLWAATSRPLWQRYQAKIRTKDMYLRRVLEHEAILDRLVARDAEGARRVMTEHFDKIIDRFCRLPERSFLG